MNNFREFGVDRQAMLRLRREREDVEKGLMNPIQGVKNVAAGIGDWNAGRKAGGQYDALSQDAQSTFGLRGETTDAGKRQVNLQTGQPLAGQAATTREEHIAQAKGARSDARDQTRMAAMQGQPAPGAATPPPPGTPAGATPGLPAGVPPPPATATPPPAPAGAGPLATIPPPGGAIPPGGVPPGGAPLPPGGVPPGGAPLPPGGVPPGGAVGALGPGSSANQNQLSHTGGAMTFNLGGGAPPVAGATPPAAGGPAGGAGSAQQLAQTAQVGQAAQRAQQGGGGILGGLATGGLSNLWAWNQRRRGRNQLAQYGQGDFTASFDDPDEEAYASADRIHKGMTHLSIRQSISKRDEDVVPTDECIGCGLAHGSPNSKYCSEICERQNGGNTDD